jgi:hypothetical protein
MPIVATVVEMNNDESLDFDDTESELLEDAASQGKRSKKTETTIRNLKVGLLLEIGRL